MLKKILHNIKRKKKYRNKVIPFGFLNNQKKFRKRKKYNFKIDLYFLNRDLFKSKIFINFSIFFILFSLLFVVFGPFLKVNRIEIIRKDYLTNIDIAYKSLDYIRGKSIFLLNFDNIKDKLRKYQINIKDINIKLSFPDLIKIEIGSYSGLFNVIVNKKNYIVTKNGVFIPMKRYSEIKDLKVIDKKLINIPILDYKQILSDKYLISIDYFINKLQENIFNLKIKDSLYYKNERELHLITDSGIRLIYDLESNIDSQIKNTVILNKQYYNIGEGGLVYIDFRIRDKIYYCSEELKQICFKNINRIYSK